MKIHEFESACTFLQKAAELQQGDSRRAACHTLVYVLDGQLEQGLHTQAINTARAICELSLHEPRSRGSKVTHEWAVESPQWIGEIHIILACLLILTGDSKSATLVMESHITPLASPFAPSVSTPTATRAHVIINTTHDDTHTNPTHTNTAHNTNTTTTNSSNTPAKNNTDPNTDTSNNRTDTDNTNDTNKGNDKPSSTNYYPDNITDNTNDYPPQDVCDFDVEYDNNFYDLDYDGDY
eukprot:c15340_g1_i1.p1 GENE.c15340_g1_i1~~c15340_g1_i1.p1  ORF type:complete len:238 (-),score=56.30 c15340_g1_i1:263-976(-)